MRFRKLRIVFSAFCALACVVLIVLWVRSYWHCDVIKTKYKQASWLAVSESGAFLIGNLTELSLADRREWRFTSYSPDEAAKPVAIKARGFQFHQTVGDVTFGGPYWCCILYAALLGGWSAFPWLRWSNRFSLRTLLLVTTLVAVVLGLAVWAAS